MIYKGYKIRVRCIDWEQLDLLDNYWEIVGSIVGYKNVVGLGMNWANDYLYFDYLLGVINDEPTLDKLKNINFSNTQFNPIYTEVELPNLCEWKTFKGKNSDTKQIYEKQVDCYNRSYDYELEYIDEKGNIEIKIHFINEQ